MSVEFFQLFIAKSDGVSIVVHTRDVRVAGANLLERLPLTLAEKIFLAPKLDTCAVLHDLGKIHWIFQEGHDIPFRHEIISLWFCENFLDLPVDELFAIATHHKAVIPHLRGAKTSASLQMDLLTRDMEEHCDSQPDLLNSETLEKWLEWAGLSLPIKAGAIRKEISPRMCRILLAVSQATAVPDIAQRQQMSTMRALLIAADHIASAGLAEYIPAHKIIDITDFQPWGKDNTRVSFRRYQERLQSMRGDAIVHVPTAGGKTTAGFCWIFANQAPNVRVFCLLPTTAACNVMARQYQPVFGKERVTVQHSRTLDFLYEHQEEKRGAAHIQAAQSASTLSAGLFYPVKITTLYQLLITAYKDKGWEFGWIDYRRALFIIDEFHTYDALLMGQMIALVKLFRRVFEARFLFMSATIPAFMMDILVRELFDGDASHIVRPDPEDASDREIIDRKRHQLYCQPGRSIQDAQDLIRSYLQEHTVLIIVNTIGAAQQLYEVFMDVRPVLLHGGLHEADRSAVEQQVLYSGVYPRLLIATQAAEVSLQLDFDVLFTENAPGDALIQRFGRCNRIGEKCIFPLDKMVQLRYNTVPVYLFEKSIGKTPFYDATVVATTWNVLTFMDTQELSEGNLIHACNQVYADGYNPSQQADFEQGLHNTAIRNFETDWIAGHHHNWMESIVHHQYSKIEVLCKNLVPEFNRDYRAGNRLLVLAYFYEVGKLEKHPYANVWIAKELEYVEGVGYKKVRS